MAARPPAASTVLCSAPCAPSSSTFALAHPSPTASCLALPCLSCLSACLPACLCPSPFPSCCYAGPPAVHRVILSKKPCATLRLPQEITICHPQPPLLPPHGKTSLRQFASKPPQDTRHDTTRHDATVEYSTRPAHLPSTMSCPLCPALPCPHLYHCPHSRRHALITHRTRWR